MQEQKNYQPELFEEFSKGHIKRRTILKGAAKTKNINIVLSQEKLIFFIIAFIIFCIIIFSLGVERGKRISFLSYSTADKEIIQMQKIVAESTEVDQAQKVDIEFTKEAEPQTSKQPQASSYKKIYTVQIAAYSNLSRAKKELKKLQKEGYKAFIEDAGKYYIVYVGKVTDKQKAVKLQKKLKAKYKDCYIKQR